MKFWFSRLIWGTFLLLAAVFVLVNQLNGFVNIGVGSVIAAILSIAIIVQCIAHLRFAPLPIPLAVLYAIFQTPLGLPIIQTWALIMVSILTSLGLAILFPRKSNRIKFKYMHEGKPGKHTRPENGDNNNNPCVSVNFGAVSRRLHAQSLETARLQCNFGAMEVFFDQVKLSPNGAEIALDCSFGAIQLFVPKHWRVIDKLNCTLGGVEVNKHFAAAENAPVLTLIGSVSLGGVEVEGV